MDKKQDVKITLYWLNQSRSQRILWLLEELNLKYELKTYKRRADGQAPPELKEIHPLGKSPILKIESEAISQPLVLAESGFIIEYLIDHYGNRLIPKRFIEGKEGQAGGETEEWIRYRYFMHYAEGSLMPYLVIGVLFNLIKTSSPFFIRPLTNLITGAIEKNFLGPNVKSNLEFLENHIASSPNKGTFLCGSELTGADIIMSFPLGAAKGRVGFTQEKYPKLWEYSDKLESFDSYKRAVNKIVEVEGSYSSNL